MLAYLAVRRSVRRDELVALLWGDMPEQAARNAFRQALHRIRKSVGGDSVVADRESLTLGPPLSENIDRDLFLAACDAGQWRAAIAFYRGDFLDGLVSDEAAFDRWADVERMNLRARFFTASHRAGLELLSIGDFVGATAAAERWAAAAPFDADAALFQGECLIAAGRAAEAANSARLFADRLRDELDLAVPPQVQALISRIERNRGASSPSAPLPKSESQSPFVARDAELARVLSGIADVRSGSGKTFVVEGEAGIGRTRFLSELRLRLRDLGGVRVLRGSERASTALVPYAGVAEALRPLVNAPGVAGASRHLLAEAARLLPELRDSIDLPEAPAIEDEAGRLRFFEGVASVIDSAAYEQPVCVMIDDLHNAASSIDLLSYLVNRLSGSPALFVLSMRSDRSQAADRIRALASDGKQGVIALSPLSSNEIRTIVEETAGVPLGVGEVDRIIRQANGRPLVAKDLASRPPAGTQAEAVVQVRDVLRARLEAVSAVERRVFFAAALLDRRASVRLLASAAHLSETASLDAANRLTVLGLLRVDEDGFVVAHPSTTAFVAESAGIAGRALLAGWAADALAEENRDVDAELAQLYAVAGRPALAFSHARAAAFHAASVGASAETLYHLNLAMSFATSDRERVEINALLSAYGYGALRIANAPGTESTRETPAERPQEPDDADYTVETESSTNPPEQPGAQRVGLVRRYYFPTAFAALILLLGVLARRALLRTSAVTTTGDSIIISRRDPRAGESEMLAVALERNGTLGKPVLRGKDLVVDSGAARGPWIEPVTSGVSGWTALSHVSAHGRELYLVSANRRDTARVQVGRSTDGITALGWSPDGRSLLIAVARTLIDGSYDSDLYAYSTTGALPIPIDTSSARSIVAATWAPTGVAIAWVARVGPSRQREIFLARADGTGLQDISRSPADDFNPSWSSDASVIAFTSTRTGGSRIYTLDLQQDKLWPVSDRDGEDRAEFSRDGRYLAFESTHDGHVEVDVRPSLGGVARSAAPSDAQYTLTGWSHRHDGWIDRIRIVGNPRLSVGDSVTLSTLSVDPTGTQVLGVSPTWSLVGDSSVVLRADGSGATLTAHREGRAKVIATIPGWRADTLTLAVGSHSSEVADDFGSTISPARWVLIGEPRPSLVPNPRTTSHHALVLNSGAEWDSGILSRSSIAVQPGLTFTATLLAPFQGRTSPASVSLGLISAGSIDDSQGAAPRQVTATIGVLWDGQSGAFRYVVGRDSYVDPDGARSDAATHVVSFRVGADSMLTFSVDGRDRWKSSLRYSSELAGARAQIWIGGHATGTDVAVASVNVGQRTSR